MLFDPNQGRHSRELTTADDELAALPVPAARECAPAGEPETDAAVAMSTPPAAAPRPAGRLRAFDAMLGWSGLAVAAVGIGLAVASTLWALRLDVPYEVALLAGYITFAATVCLCAALVAVRYYAKAKAAVIEARAMAAAEIREVFAAETVAAPAPVVAPDAAESVQSEAEPAAEIAAPAPAVETVENAAPAPVEEAAPILEAAPVLEVAPVEETAAAADETGEEPDLEPEPTPETARPARRRARPRVRHAEPDDFDTGHDLSPVPVGPDYAAWARVENLRVADAARLWCGLAPGDHVTDEVSKWASAMLEAVRRGELAKCESTGVLAQYKIGWHTEVPREALKAWALAQGETPRFLADTAEAA